MIELIIFCRHRVLLKIVLGTAKYWMWNSYYFLLSLAKSAEYSHRHVFIFFVRRV